MRQLLVLILAGVAAGCANHYVYRTGIEASGPRRTVTEWRHFIAWGLSDERRLNLESVCEDGAVLEFGSYVSVQNWPLAVLSVGFYSPRTVYAICANGKGKR